MKPDRTETFPPAREIVIVEDDPLLRTLMTELLVDVEAETVTFVTADDALMHVVESRGKCSLLITDHGVPGQIKGAELASMVRHKWPDVPVILTSGYELDTSSIPEGVTYLQKPWPINTLIEAVQSLLPATIARY